MNNKFLLYHPYLTYSNTHNLTHFVDPDGKTVEDFGVSMEALFHIGRTAYNMYPTILIKSKQDLDNVNSEYLDLLMQERKYYQENKVDCQDFNGNNLNIDWHVAQDHQLLSTIWFYVSRSKSLSDPLVVGKYANILLFYVLNSIDLALGCIKIKHADAAFYSIEAANALANLMALPISGERDEILKEARQEISKLGGIARVKKDPKTEEKKFVFDLWQAWQKSPSTYKYKSDFAKDMLDKNKHLKSQKVIEDWCRDWEKLSQPAE